MKKISFYKTGKAAISLVCLGVITVAPAKAAIPTYYEISDLGELNGDDRIEPSINDDGQVVGRMINRAYLWENGVVTTDLGTFAGGASWAYDINNSGQVAGYSNNNSDKARAFLWDDGQSPKMRNLGTLDNSDSAYQSWAYGINDSGQVVGFSGYDKDEAHAFLWDSGTMTDFGTLGYSSSWAFDINDSQQVVGILGDFGAPTAFLWETGTMNTLGGGNSTAYQINNAGLIVGRNGSHASLWDSGGVTDLGHLGGNYSEAYAINDLLQPQVVGGSRTAGYDWQAFIWDAGSMYNLNDLLLPGSGWVLSNATEINSSGQIVGNGLLNGETHSFLLTPVPEPASLLLLGAGLVGLFGIGANKKKRL